MLFRSAYSGADCLAKAPRQLASGFQILRLSRTDILVCPFLVETNLRQRGQAGMPVLLTRFKAFYATTVRVEHGLVYLVRSANGTGRAVAAGA